MVDRPRIVRPMGKPVARIEIIVDANGQVQMKAHNWGVTVDHQPQPLDMFAVCNLLLKTFEGTFQQIQDALVKRGMVSNEDTQENGPESA